MGGVGGDCDADPGPVSGGGVALALSMVADPQRLEHDAEEPRQQDVAGHQPGQLAPVLLALAEVEQHLGEGAALALALAAAVGARGGGGEGGNREAGG